MSHYLPVTMNGRKVGEVIEQQIGETGDVYATMVITDPGIAAAMMEGLDGYTISPEPAALAPSKQDPLMVKPSGPLSGTN